MSEFSHILELARLKDNQLVIWGDFNIHMDNEHSSEATSLNDLLYPANLKQLVSQPTHSRGHTLDLVITRESSNCIRDLSVLPAMPSDHSASVCSVGLSRPVPVRKVFQFRKLRDLDYDNFRSDLECVFAEATNLDCLDLDAKVNFYNSSLARVLDHHAPVKSASVQLRPQAPWYDNHLIPQVITQAPWYHNHLILQVITQAPWYDNHLITLKRRVRAAERKWRKCLLTVNKDIMKSALS